MNDLAGQAAGGPAVVAARRRGGLERIEHEVSFVLHSYAWRETSLVIDVFSRHHGRTALVARGAKRPTSQFRGLLAPFSPLALTWSGRGEIKSLTRVEWLGGLAPLRGEGLLAAFYLNELLVRLLARGDPHESLFGDYVAALRGLSGDAAGHPAVLRDFELALLRAAGWLPPLDHCADGAAISADAWYRIDPQHGFERAHGDPDERCVRGATIEALARRQYADPATAGECKTLLRRLIRYHLNGQPLNTRRIFQDLKQL